MNTGLRIEYNWKEHEDGGQLLMMPQDAHQ